MEHYLYILGRTPELAILELATFSPHFERLHDQVITLDTHIPIRHLGGTVKIARVLGELAELTPAGVAPFIDTTHRTVFGISVFGGPSVHRTFLEDVKSLLVGKSARYIEARDGELSSVVVSKQDVQELIIVKQKTGYCVARTIEVQDFETWNHRDFDRPHADPKAGMLPIKVARMVVNIADGSRDVANVLSQKTLLDPFCGMGTVLGEGLAMGWNVVGGDVEEDVVQKARENLKWLTSRYPVPVTARVIVSDAVHISEKIDHDSIDAIVTEPYMGATNVSANGRWASGPKNTVKGLEKLYIGCLRDWQQVLKQGGRVVMALPQYDVGGKRYFVKKVIDMCEMLGYTIQAGPIAYGRPGAIVTRQFFVLQKN